MNENSIEELNLKKKDICQINRSWDDISDEILNRWRKHCQSMAWMHEKSAERYKFLQKLIEIPGFVLGSLATGSFVTYIFEKNYTQNLVSIAFVILNVISNITSLMQMVLGLHTKHHNHDRAAKAFRILEQKMEREYKMKWSSRKNRDLSFEKFNRNYQKITEDAEPIPKRIRKTFYHRKMKKNKDDFFDNYILKERKKDGIEEYDLLKKLKTILTVSDSSSIRDSSTSNEEDIPPRLVSQSNEEDKIDIIDDDRDEQEEEVINSFDENV